MKRVAAIGNSGSEKSTPSAVLSTWTGLLLVASDPFYWERGWKAASPHAVRQRVTEATAGGIWIIDGHFASERDVVWARADTIVWLDYPLSLVLWRVSRRNLGWFLTRQAVWSGSRMSLSRAWSGIRHASRSFAQKRATYPAFLAKLPHLNILHFRSPHQVNCWLSGLDERED